VIVLSVIQLALETPLNDPNGDVQNALTIIDILTTTIFTLEFIVKLIALGAFCNG
jgi:hypothetical protein